VPKRRAWANLHVSRRGADWRYMITIAAIPALLFALWGAKRAYRRLHSMARDRLHKQDGPLEQTA